MNAVGGEVWRRRFTRVPEGRFRRCRTWRGVSLMWFSLRAPDGALRLNQACGPDALARQGHMQISRRINAPPRDQKWRPHPYPLPGQRLSIFSILAPERAKKLSIGVHGFAE